MLRTIFVFMLVGIGAIYTLHGPFYALLFYIGNAYFRPEQWVWTDLIGKLNLSYLSGAWLLLLTLITRPRFILNGRTALLLLFLLFTFISTVFSDYSAYIWPYWIEFLKTIIITYLIVVLTTDTMRFRLLLLVIVLALGLEQGKQGWYSLLLSSDSQNMNLIPFLGDNNGVAAGMVMLIPIIAYLARTTQHTWTRWGYWFLLVGCLFRAITTYSRGGFLACAALGSVYLLRTRQKLRALVGILVIIMVILPALPDAFWARMNTIQTYEEDTSATGRLHFWQVAMIMANANPLLGVGFNAYNAAYNTYDFSHGEYGRGRSVHSSFFGVLAETGYIGFALWVAVLLGAFWSCYCIQKHAVMGSIPVELAHGAAAFEASLVAFVVSGIFLPGQYGEMFFHFIGITIVLQQLADQHRIAHGKRSGGRPLGGVTAHAETTYYPA
jgi:putative inorganic carbon (hco3(-)) transporter